MAHQLAQIVDMLGIALVSSVVISVIALVLTFKTLILTDVSRPWKLAGCGFIVSMLSTFLLVYIVFCGGPYFVSFVFFLLLYLPTGVFIYTALWKLEKANDDPSGAWLG